MFKKICGGVIALVLLLAFWGCSDSGSSTSNLCFALSTGQTMRLKSQAIKKKTATGTCVLWMLSFLMRSQVLQRGLLKSRG